MESKITLTANPQGWRLFMTRKADPAFRASFEAVMKRDNATCQYCGFQSEHFAQVVNKDQDYHNNKLENLVTACCFCSQCFFIESVGFDNTTGGTLIYLPDMSQVDLNGLCHVLFCAMANNTDCRTDAQTIYRDLKLRSQVVDTKLGDGMSEPVKLAQLLLETAQQCDDGASSEILKDLRLLPARSRFTKQIDAWAKEAGAHRMGSQHK